jgi:hypothetical protein
MRWFLFYNKFIICLYMFRVLLCSSFDVLLAVHLSIFISVINQLDAQNLFYYKFYFTSLHVSSTCAHHQEVKITLHSLWYHHTETTEWSKITKIQFCKYQHMAEKRVYKYSTFSDSFCSIIIRNLDRFLEILIAKPLHGTFHIQISAYHAL